MMNINANKIKKNVLIIMGRYLPGYKDGGPVRSIKNLVDYLGEKHNFMILTCDRDHGDLEAYKGIKVHDWNKVGNASVYYVPPKGFSFKVIKELAKQADMIYVCGCFNDYAINTLILKRFNLIKMPVVVAAMGLFSPMEFRLKYKKKKLFITMFNILGMFKNIYWSATSEMEVSEIKMQVKTKNNFFIAEDFPRKVSEKTVIKSKEPGKLNVVFISRIAPKKNLKGAIQVLKNVKSNINFTIYGTKHVAQYWEECKDELERLPSNIRWSYDGAIDSEQVVEVLKKQHVFLFPTFGENYGHVIHEALSAGCPCIISDQTPWQDLEQNCAGYVYHVDNIKAFAEAIEFYSEQDEEAFQKLSRKALSYAIKCSTNKVNESGYLDILDAAL